ncbi:hypothetical protein F4818DRAFT_442170 [Hypoxylon cercidicola]|nr:hypothetical protein F4818DRAFT_442170 [Hypoxylon cercidicola]
MTETSLHDKLDALYEVWMGLTPSSPPQAFTAFTRFFAHDCRAWLSSAQQEPTEGHAKLHGEIRAAVEAGRARIQRRQVTGRLVCGRSSKRVAVEMRNRILVSGAVRVDQPEMAVATFDDDGLITEFKVYSRYGPVVGSPPGTCPAGEGDDAPCGELRARRV